MSEEWKVDPLEFDISFKSESQAIKAIRSSLEKMRLALLPTFPDIDNRDKFLVELEKEIAIQARDYFAKYPYTGKSVHVLLALNRAKYTAHRFPVEIFQRGFPERRVTLGIMFLCGIQKQVLEGLKLTNDRMNFLWKSFNLTTDELNILGKQGEANLSRWMRLLGVTLILAAPSFSHKTCFFELRWSKGKITIDESVGEETFMKGTNNLSTYIIKREDLSWIGERNSVSDLTSYHATKHDNELLDQVADCCVSVNNEIFSYLDIPKLVTYWPVKEVGDA